MSRSGKTPKRTIPPDPVFCSVAVQRFINKIMIEGKKSVAEKIVYGALTEAGQKLQKDPLEVFEKALKNITPLLEVKARRVGGATYQIPIEVSKSRGEALAMQWLRDTCRKRKGKGMRESLCLELIDAYNGSGAALKMREDLHKTAEANKAFAHFRW